MKSIAILQSNYIPWKGYFDLAASVDEFVILDSVQYTKNDWRNRNRIRSGQGPAWLTIPVRTAGRFGQQIAEARIADRGWARRHWRSIAQNYSHMPGFRPRAAELEEAYNRASAESHLSAVNRIFIRLVCGWLGIGTPITSSERYPDQSGRVERLIAICRAAGAERYVTGPRAAAYLDAKRFADAGVRVDYFNYSAYPEPKLSVLDWVLRT